MALYWSEFRRSLKFCLRHSHCSPFDGLGFFITFCLCIATRKKKFNAQHNFKHAREQWKATLFLHVDQSTRMQNGTVHHPTTRCSHAHHSAHVAHSFCIQKCCGRCCVTESCQRLLENGKLIACLLYENWKAAASRLCSLHMWRWIHIAEIVICGAACDVCRWCVCVCAIQCRSK